MVTKSRAASAVLIPKRTGWSGTVRWREVCPYAYEQAMALLPTNMQTVYANAGTIEYTNGKQRENYCYHVKDKFTWHDNAWYCVCKDATATGFQTGGGNLGPSSLPTIPASPTPEVITDQLRALAWEGLRPKLETGFSMANFLLELRELPHLISQARRLLNSVRAAQLALRKAGLNPSLTAAELHLLWSFAIKPLISDISSLYSDLTNTEKLVDQFIKDGKRVRAYHFTHILSEVETQAGGVKYLGYIYDVEKHVYHATLHASYSFAKPSFFDGFSRVMGLRPTPEVLWNAIPFSFLIDYGLKIANFLGQFDRDERITVHIHDYSDSMKSSIVRREVRHTDGSMINIASYPNHTGASNGTLVWSWETSSYIRQPGTPNTGYAFPVWDELSLRELVLAGALALTAI